MKTILCIAPYAFLPAETGGQKAIASLYRTMSENFRIICISTKNNKPAKQETLQLKKIFSNSFLRYINPFYFFIVIKIIKEEKPDYLQIEHPYFGWLAILLKKFTGIKFIVRSHNIEGLRFKNLGKPWWKILSAYEKWVLRNADFIFFITDVDKQYAVLNFQLSPKKTSTITFGINLANSPSDKQRETARELLLKRHNIDTTDIIILFNGAFNYSPNAHALNNLLKYIFPFLNNLSNKKFKLLVCGKGIPAEVIKENINDHIIFTGFVADIETYLTGSTIFVNPVIEGGGIKTKLVEALAYNLNCVSFATGAIGVPGEVCGNKLIVVNDNDYKNFANAIIIASDIASDVPPAFHSYFSNKKILGRIKDILD